MDRDPRDALYRWLVELAMNSPRVTFTAHPPDPPHSAWLPAGTELDMREARRACAGIASDVELELLWQELSRVIQALNSGAVSLRELTGEWAVKLYGELPSKPARELFQEMTGGLDLGGLLHAIRTGEHGAAHQDDDAAGDDEGGEDDGGESDGDAFDNIVSLFPPRVRRGTPPASRDASVSAPSDEPERPAGRVATAAASATATDAPPAASCVEVPAAPRWRARAGWAALGALGALGVAAVFVAVLGWPADTEEARDETQPRQPVAIEISMCEPDPRPAAAEANRDADPTDPPAPDRATAAVSVGGPDGDDVRITVQRRDRAKPRRDGHAGDSARTLTTPNLRFEVPTRDGRQLLRFELVP